MHHFWPLVIGTSAVLYCLMLISLPFSALYATLFLYTLISYWSRIPGVSIPTPFFALYFTDIVDFMGLVIAINVGGGVAAVFTVFCNIVSRAGGVTPPWNSVIRATINQAIICVIIPFIHHATGENLFLSMILYTVLFRVGFIIQYVITPWMGVTQFVVLWTGVTVAMVVINGTYAYLFGSLFNHLLQTGVQFSWSLFILVTIVMVIGKVLYFGMGKTKKTEQPKFMPKRKHFPAVQTSVENETIKELKNRI